MGYTKDAIRGISWSTALRVFTRIVAFFRIAILARILNPIQFGLFGIASLVLSFLEIITETGLYIILIQEKKEIEKYIDSAWVISILRGIIICLFIVISAGIIAAFFNSPGSYPIIIGISLVPLIRGFINPSIISIQKELKFNKVFLLNSVLFITDAVFAIIAAFITKSAVSFVYGLLASACLEVFLSFVFFRPIPRFKFNRSISKNIIKRGWWVTITGIFSYFAENGDNIVVGKIMGASSLGIYQVAYKFSTLPISEITNVVNSVVFPVYSKFSEDKNRLLNGLIKVLSLSTVGAFLLSLFIFIFADKLVHYLLGEAWISAIPVIRVLSVYGFLRTVFANFSPAFLALGRQDLVAKMTFFRVLGLIIIIIPFVRAYGLIGAAFAALTSILIEIPVIIYFFNKEFKK